MNDTDGEPLDRRSDGTRVPTEPGEYPEQDYPEPYPQPGGGTYDPRGPLPIAPAPLPGAPVPNAPGPFTETSPAAPPHERPPGTP